MFNNLLLKVTEAHLRINEKTNTTLDARTRY
jgi:hypothetical protein